MDEIDREEAIAMNETGEIGHMIGLERTIGNVPQRLDLI